MLYEVGESIIFGVETDENFWAWLRVGVACWAGFTIGALYEWKQAY